MKNEGPGMTNAFIMVSRVAVGPLWKFGLLASKNSSVPGNKMLQRASENADFEKKQQQLRLVTHLPWKANSVFPEYVDRQ